MLSDSQTKEIELNNNLLIFLVGNLFILMNTRL